MGDAQRKLRRKPNSKAQKQSCGKSLLGFCAILEAMHRARRTTRTTKSMPKKSNCATKLQNPSYKTSEHLIVTDMCNRHYG
jgi:hypothetical protein